VPHEPHQPIQQLLRSGRNDEAVALLAPIVASKPDDLAARELMFDAQFQRRSWAEALAEAEVLRKMKPDSLRYRRFVIATLSNMKRYDEVAADARQHLAKHGEDVEILNTLKIAYFYLGKTKTPCAAVSACWNCATPSPGKMQTVPGSHRRRVARART
jgi:protein involved in temperature-dependent protein secretion